MTHHNDFLELARGFLGLSDADWRLMQQSATANFPPVDIYDTSDDSAKSLRIDLAVAGWRQEDISIEVDNRVLTINGRTSDENKPSGVEVTRGIARRNFKRQFKLAEFYEVDSASMSNGILSINIVKIVPDHARPKTIAIEHAS